MTAKKYWTPPTSRTNIANNLARALAEFMLLYVFLLDELVELVAEATAAAAAAAEAPLLPAIRWWCAGSPYNRPDGRLGMEWRLEPAMAELDIAHCIAWGVELVSRPEIRERGNQVDCCLLAVLSSRLLHGKRLVCFLVSQYLFSTTKLT